MATMKGSDGATYAQNENGQWVDWAGRVLTQAQVSELMGQQGGAGGNWVMTNTAGQRIGSNNPDTQAIIDAETAARENKDWVNQNIMPLGGQLGQASEAVTRGGIEGLAQRDALNNAANQWDTGLGGFVTGSNAQANAAANNLNTTFAGEQDLLNQADWGSYGNYLSNTSGLYGMVQGQGYTPIQNDAYGVGLQNNAIGNFSNIYGGGLDYTSQGAQAYADPRAVQEQWNVYGDLRGAGQGNLDVTSQGAKAYADADADMQHRLAIGQLGGIGQGSLDVTSQAAGARADADAVAGMKDVMGRYKALSDPSVTAQERFLMETARRKAEHEQKGLRGAVARDQQLRGVRSGGAEIVDALGGGQQISEDRVLADLGMQANAVARAERMLAGYGGTASDIRKQSFGEDFSTRSAADATSHANADRRTSATGMYVDATGKLRSATFDEAFGRGTAADTVAMSNAEKRLQAMGYSAEQITAMRDASFNEAYKRGTAADDAAANNQRVRSQAATDYGSMATDIRTANDLTSRFNTEQAGITQRHIEELASAERTRVGTLAKDSADLGLDTTNQMGARSTAKLEAGQSTINSNNARDMTTADVWKQIGDDAYARGDTRINQEGDLYGDYWNRQAGLADFGLAAGGLYTGGVRSDQQNVTQARTIAAGNDFSRQAAAQLAEEDDGGPYGFVKKIVPFLP